VTSAKMAEVIPCYSESSKIRWEKLVFPGICHKLTLYFDSVEGLDCNQQL
jgi:hypothetical protein